MSRRTAKNLPKDVERYVQEHKDQGADESKAWALAWSRYCEYKNPDSPHCKQDNYFPGKKKASLLHRVTKLAYDNPDLRKELLPLIKQARTTEMGIDVSSYAERVADWWGDLEEYIREYWSMQKVDLKRGRGKIVFRAKMSGRVRRVEIKGPASKPTVYVGGAEKTFDSKTPINKIIYWVDKTAMRTL